MSVENENEPVELTARELAIIGGKDPDAIAEAATENRDGAGAETDDAASSTPADDESTAESVGEPVKDEVPSGGGKEAADSAVPSWIKDDHRELAKSYELTDEDLRDFASETEFRRATRLIDKQFASQAAPQQQQQAPPPAPEPPKATDSLSVKKTPDLDPDKFKAAGYDDEVLNVVQFAKEREAELQKLRDQIETQKREAAEAEYRRTYETLEATYDGMDGRRYGRRTGKDGSQRQLTPGERESRDKVNQAANMLAAGILATGKQLPPLNILLKRAEALTFADDIRADERRKVQASITEQSKKRRPVAGQRPVAPAMPTTKGMTINEQAKHLANTPAIVKAWEDAQQAAGAV